MYSRGREILQQSGMETSIGDENTVGNTVGDGKYNPEWELQSEMGNTVGMENTVGDGQYCRGWKYSRGWEKQSRMGSAVGNLFKARTKPKNK